MRRNVYVDVYRSPAATSGTQVPALLLTQVAAFLFIDKRDGTAVMQTSAIKDIYHMHVDVNTDIRRMDVIRNIVRIDTGLVWDTDTDTEVWRVIEAKNTQPGPLEFRMIKIARMISSGPMPV